MQPDLLPLMTRSSWLNSELQISMSFSRWVIEDEIKRRSSAYIIIDKQLKPIRQPRPLFSTAMITSFTKIARKTGDNTPPCRTPACNQYMLDLTPFQTTVAKDSSYHRYSNIIKETGKRLDINFEKRQ